MNRNPNTSALRASIESSFPTMSREAKRLILEALKDTTQKDAAARLGIDEGALRKMLRKLEAMDVWHIRCCESRQIRRGYRERETVVDLFLCGVDWPRNARGGISTDLDHDREGTTEIHYALMSRRAMRGAQRGRKDVTCSACLAALDRFRETGRLPRTKREKTRTSR